MFCFSIDLFYQRSDQYERFFCTKLDENFKRPDRSTLTGQSTESNKGLCICEGIMPFVNHALFIASEILLP